MGFIRESKNQEMFCGRWDGNKKETLHKTKNSLKIS